MSPGINATGYQDALLRAVERQWCSTHGVQLAPRTMSKSANGSICEWFDLVDDRKVGTLCIADFERALQSVHVSADRGALREMVALADFDGDGRISRAEFLHLMSREIAAGRDPLGAEYVLPSGRPLALGMMIAKLRRRRMMAQILEGGEARSVWADKSDRANEYVATQLRLLRGGGVEPGRHRPGPSAAYRAATAAAVAASQALSSPRAGMPHPRHTYEEDGGYVNNPLSAATPRWRRGESPPHTYHHHHLPPVSTTDRSSPTTGARLSLAFYPAAPGSPLTEGSLSSPHRPATATAAATGNGTGPAAEDWEEAPSSPQPPFARSQSPHLPMSPTESCPPSPSLPPAHPPQVAAAAAAAAMAVAAGPIAQYHRSVPSTPHALERNWRGPKAPPPPFGSSPFHDVGCTSPSRGGGSSASVSLMSPRGVAPFAPHPMGIFLTPDVPTIHDDVLQAERAGAAARCPPGAGGYHEDDEFTGGSGVRPHTVGGYITSWSHDEGALSPAGGGSRGTTPRTPGSPNFVPPLRTFQSQLVKTARAMHASPPGHPPDTASSDRQSPPSSRTGRSSRDSPPALHYTGGGTGGGGGSPRATAGDAAPSLPSSLPSSLPGFPGSAMPSSPYERWTERLGHEGRNPAWGTGSPRHHSVPRGGPQGTHGSGSSSSGVWGEHPSLGEGGAQPPQRAFSTHLSTKSWMAVAGAPGDLQPRSPAPPRQRSPGTAPTPTSRSSSHLAVIEGMGTWRARGTVPG